MAKEQAWTIVFYTDERGNSPVEEFIEGLDAKTKARFVWSIEQLRVRNVKAREPLVKHLEDKLWELREESRTNIYRVIYVFFARRQIVLLHGFQKKGQKTPQREIKMAQSRLNNFLERMKPEGEE